MFLLISVSTAKMTTFQLILTEVLVFILTTFSIANSSILGNPLWAESADNCGVDAPFSTSALVVEWFSFAASALSFLTNCALQFS